MSVRLLALGVVLVVAPGTRMLLNDVFAFGVVVSGAGAVGELGEGALRNCCAVMPAYMLALLPAVYGVDSGTVVVGLFRAGD